MIWKLEVSLKLDRTTDIESVDYYSDGNTLGAILWLYFPVRPQPNPINEEVDYGVYIDADFDDNRGITYASLDNYHCGQILLLGK